MHRRSKGNNQFFFFFPEIGGKGGRERGRKGKGRNEERRKGGRGEKLTKNVNLWKTFSFIPSSLIGSIVSFLFVLIGPILSAFLPVSSELSFAMTS